MCCFANLHKFLTKIHSEPDYDDAEPFTSPAKRYKQSRRRVVVDDFDKDAIRRKIYKLYDEKQHVTLSSLLV